MKTAVRGVLLLIAWVAATGAVAGVQAATSAPELRITNAYDAFGAQRDGLHHDFGFSSVIEYRGKTILFDAGTDAATFELNLQTLKIDPATIDIAILSHGHYDHMGGFDYLRKINPDVEIYLPNDFFSLGAPIRFPFREAEPEVAATLSKDEQYFRGERVVEGMLTVPTGHFSGSNVHYVSVPVEVMPGLTIVPTTSQLMGTFIRYPPFDKEPQYIGMPELSASFATASGQVVIAGCSHSTIESIIQDVRKVSAQKIRLVAGGFHLIPYGREHIQGLAQRMKDEYGVELVAPAHCTGHLGFAVLHQVYGDDYRFFGLGETLEL